MMLFLAFILEAVAISFIYYIILKKKLGILPILSIETETLKTQNTALLETLNKMEQSAEEKTQTIIQNSAIISDLKARLEVAKNYEALKITLEQKLENANRELVKMQEKLVMQERLERDLQILLEKAKEEITNQNRTQYQAIHDQLKKYTEEKSKEMTKEASEAFNAILEKDIKETMVKMQENLHLQQQKLIGFEKPVEFFTKVLSGSKEAGLHGEQTIINTLDAMGLKYGRDYLTQVTGKGEAGERLIADIVILVPNSGKKDVLIIDSKSSTKISSNTAEFMQSIESSFNIFAKKDYKTAVEKRLKEEFPQIEINQTHSFIYLPFERMLARISEEKPVFLQKAREREIGILTPIILDFLLNSIKLYSSKLEMKEQSEIIMQDVAELINRTGKVLEFIKDLGKSINLTAKKYSDLQSSVAKRFVPAVNKMAKPLNVKMVSFNTINEEDLKEISLLEEERSSAA